MSVAEQQKQLALAALNFRLDAVEVKMGRLIPRLTAADKAAAQEWIQQVTDLGDDATTDQLQRQLRKGTRLLPKLKSVPRAPPAPPPPGAPPAPPPPPPGVARAAAAPTGATAMFAQIRALQERARKCQLLPGDQARIDALGTFILKESNAQRLRKKGYNPVDVALMTVAQRKEALAQPDRKCYSEAERLSLLADNPFSYTLRRGLCLPRDTGEGEFASEPACLDARRNQAAKDQVDKFLDIAYGKGVAGKGGKDRFDAWRAESGESWVATWDELKETGIPEITREELDYREVYDNPEVQEQISILQEKAKMLRPGVDRNAVEQKIQTLRNEHPPRLEPQTIYVPDEARQKSEARDFFQGKVGGLVVRDDETTQLRRANASLRRELQNIKAGTQMESSQQQYLQGEISSQHAPALQDLEARISQLETAEKADTSAVAALKKEWAELLQKYSEDRGSLNNLLTTQGTNKTYHDYVAQQVQEQIEAQVPSIGMQVQAVTQSAAFRRALKRRS